MLRSEIASGLRAIPAARCAVIAFSVEETPREVFVVAVTYGGADWTARPRPPEHAIFYVQEVHRIAIIGVPHRAIDVAAYFGELR
jgi:hypothetical protein